MKVPKGLVFVCFLQLAVTCCLAQTVLFNFNPIGQYTNNFFPWNDTGNGNGGAYSFGENPTNGVAGSGGVGVLNANDMTATYRSGSWNFAAQGATITESVLITPGGQFSGSKIQLGVANSPSNGLNNNAGVAFESFRFLPQSATVWQLFEQYRSGGNLTSSSALGTVTVTPGHWYKFVVNLQNTSGATGNFNASSSLYDYGVTGTAPGANLVTFPAATSHTATDIAVAAVWPALRVQGEGIGAWDNFLVYTTNSLPVITWSTLTNLSLTPDNLPNLSVLADGPGPISYAWYTNGNLVAGVSGSNYTVAPLAEGLTQVMVVVANGNGSVTNSATLSLITNLTPVVISGFNRDLVVENTAVGPPYNAYASEFNPGEGSCYYEAGLPGTSLGLPVSGAITSVIDGTLFQMQPYTASNALVLSSDTGITSATLTLAVPAQYSELAILANSGGASPTSTGVLTIQFADGTSFATNYNAYDWFFNSGFAIEGLDRLELGGGTTGSSTDPRMYQTTIDLNGALGVSNRPIAALTFAQAAGANATAIYAISGLLGPQTNVFTAATLTNSPATAVQSSSATISGQVLSVGGDVPVVTIYYGLSDGGANPANWSNSVVVGVTNGPFSQSITGLTDNSAYYFTASAANAAGVAWASPSGAFRTGIPGAPQVVNLPASGIGATLATLNGQVLTSGGEPTSVILYYGPTDGGTNAGSWAGRIPLGLQSGTFQQTVSGLSAHTSYYYTAEATNVAGVSWAAPSRSVTTGTTNPISTATAVLTFHNDNSRLGVNTNETILTLANVNTNTFGRLFTYPVDGYVYAEPLVMTNVAILGRGTHNVVFVATEHDSVYAFDADSNQGANAAPLWQVSFLNPTSGVTTVSSGDVGTSDIVPEVGITATPVIDPVTGTLYVEVKTKEISGSNTSFMHRLHALDITSGAERTNGPVINSPGVIYATNYPGLGAGGSDTDGTNVLWNGLREHSRPALTLLNGVIYIAYASHGDNTPYHGWLFAYSATNVAQQIAVYNSTPNGTEGGFWQAGGGPSIDSDGFMYLQTGNGTFDASGTNFRQASNDFGMSVLKFAVTNGIKLVDYFAPSNAVALSDQDQDLGASAAIILPDAAGSSAHPHLIMGGGKTPPMYIMDRSNLGQFACPSCNNNIVQQFNGGPDGDRDTAPAFFNNTLYVMGANGLISAFSVSNAVFNTNPVQTPDYYPNKGGATMSLSANGTNGAIAWAIANDGNDLPTAPCILRAYIATNISRELYSSDWLASRDAAGTAVKFTVPTIVNGKVYVGGQYSLTVYGEATAFVATPTISPNGESFVSSATVTLADATPNATIYYTLNGSTPTTNSLLYTTPFVLTNSAEVQAIAVSPGAANSAVASAGFVNTASIGDGTGLLGQYWSNVTSVAFTNLAFALPPSLVRTDLTVNFNWTNSSPDPSISATNFAVLWSGSVLPQFNETYTFSARTDAGVLLWVNGQLLINGWVNQTPATRTASLPLVAQQRYDIVMEYFYQNQGGAVAQLSWSSPSTPLQIIPASQLFPATNPPPVVSLTSPLNGAAATATASVSLSANADALYNTLSGVAFYANNILLGSVTNAPYELTVPGLAAGNYTLTAVATDGSGLASTSAPVSLTVTNGSGLPYGLTNLAPNPAFFNMPGSFDGSSFGSIPAQLSLTGVFTNTAAMSAYAGFIPYLPNTPLWSDGALKLRYFAVPNSGAPFTPNEQIGFAPTGSWTFPAGTVFVKTFELQTNQSDPASIHRLETRLLVRDVNGGVFGVTYKWRPDNSDADLLTTSSNETFAITTPSGTVTQTWYYPSPADCLTCHTPVANYVLGVNTRQLNGNLTYSNGVTDNQLRAINRLGLFNPAIDEANITNYEQLSSITNPLASFESRARSYLDANCAQCHQPGGAGPSFDARFDTPLTNQDLIYGVLSKGNLGYDHAYVIVPKDIWRSVLFDRINTVDPAIKMPPLARNLIDTNAVAVFAGWINSLPGIPAEAPPLINPHGGTFFGSITVSLQAPDTNATLFYTLDGSLPTTNSLLYIAPFPLSNTAVVSANAYETNFNTSVAATAQFTLQTNMVLSAPLFLNGGAFQLQFTAAPNQSYVLQASANLVNWVPLSTNTPASSPFFWVDPAASNFPARFYRVVQLP